MRRILFPVDFSDCSAATAPHVAAMARALKARVTLLYVLENPDLPCNGPQRSLAAHRQDYAERQLSAYLLDQLPAADRAVRQGDAAAEIVRHACVSNTDLIMMPTRGAGGMRRFLIGSVAAKVLHDAQCPVWTGVHLDGSRAPSDRLEPVLCAVNPADNSTPALRWAADFAQTVHGRLVVAHAMPAAFAREGDGSGERERLLRWQAQALQAVEDLLDRESIHADVVMHAGEPPKVVASVAERIRAALVVIGRGSAGGMSGTLKANAYSIVRGSPCPVVSV